VKIGPASIKTSGYVDDVVIIASSDYDLTTTIEILAKFEKMTNSKLNRNKCSALTFGTWKTEDNWPQTWLKRVNKLKILGITFKHTLNETIKENCKMLKKTFTKAVLSTSNRNFTLLQKTFYTNTYLIPIVSFLAKILLIPKKTARQLQGILNKYIWSGTLEKLKQKETFAKVKDGGTGTVNLENKTESLFIATFIKQFMKNGTYKLESSAIGPIDICLEDFEITTESKPGFSGKKEGGDIVALDTRLTPELAAEGHARELVHKVQNLRKDAGFDVATAADGQEALAQLSGGRFDCLVTDVEMPGMDGYELTRHVRTVPALAHLPVVVVTTHDRPEERLKGLEAGADAYLAKQGLDARELVALVKRLGGS